MKQSFLKKLLTGLLVGLGSGLIIWFLSQVLFKHFFFQIEAPTYDRRLRVVTDHPENPVEDIVIVDVDARSVSKLGSYHQWPRTYWANLVSNLTESGVSLIGIDFIFDPDRRHPEEDKEFQRALFESGKVCGALYFAQADAENFRPAMMREPEGLSYEQFIHNLPASLSSELLDQERLEPDDPAFLNACATAGYVNLFPDPDGVLRRIPVFLEFNQHAYAAFSVEMALELMQINGIEHNAKNSRIVLKSDNQEKMQIPIDEHGQILINYIGGFKSFRYISFYDVLMNFVPPGYFENKVVLIGSSLPGLYDLRSIPLQGAYPGVEVNANVLYQILQNRFITKMSDVTYFIFLLLCGVLVGMILIFPRPVGSIILAIVLIVLTVIAGFLALDLYSYWLPMIAPALVIILVFASTYIYRYMFEERDKRRIRKVFNHYVSSSVVDVMLKNPEKVKLGGERKFCSVLFSDVAGFTTLSEQLEPEALVTLLNEYLTDMTDIIFEHRGMLDKYEGDAIMAVYGAPVEFPEHADMVCRSALKMQKRLKELRESWKSSGKPQLHARIGINSGDMVVGNMGSETRFDYTVMGDSVNLASRLEGANKLYGTEIMIGEKTLELIKDSYLTRPLDMLRVKGKKKPVKVYELIADRQETVTPEMKEMLGQYQKGFENYLMRNWEWAMNHFRQALQIKSDDGPARLYLLRCQEFVKNPPGDDWDGVFVMKTK